MKYPGLEVRRTMQGKGVRTCGISGYGRVEGRGGWREGIRSVGQILRKKAECRRWGKGKEYYKVEKGQEENERGPGSVRWLEEGIVRRDGETEEKKP